MTNYATKHLLLIVILDTVMGSDVVFEAVLEIKVARNVKDFFSQPQNLEKLE